MGAKLCCMSLSTSDFSSESKAIEGHEQKPPSRSTRLNFIIRPSRMKKEDEEKKKKRDHDQRLPPEKKAMKMRNLATLEEWLLSSPGMKPADSITGGELHVFKQLSKHRVHPSSSRVHAELITPSPGDRIISLDRIDEGDHHGGGEETLEVGSSVGRSKSGQLGRKVTFRRPEADIIVFYSPEGTYEESNEDSP
ncbi:hypothetical protein PVL29_012513 [Vitis rotundifolia]|uniref:Uncharacterized protein n=1 Tax=Vitis rotundifolia TaxID=103349 RepID=A0AA38ZIU7_VITRO|nr:hypothetical protein PVL29_012513 [Vitis rotundifolia]